MSDAHSTPSVPSAGVANIPSASVGLPGQTAEALQWQAMQQAFYKQNPGAAFLPAQFPAQWAATWATQPLLYNAQLMNSRQSLHPFAFLPGAVPETAHGLPPAAPSGKDMRQQDSQEGAQKRPRRERSGADLRQAGDPAEPSRSSGTRSPESDPASEQRNGGTGISGDEDRQTDPAQGHAGTSSSVQNLAVATGPPALKDEREVKKLRRKQSNRESARRSRLRKQAECEALSGKVDMLQAENHQLREANRALVARIEELVAKLEQRPIGGQPTALNSAGENSAFTPLAPAAKPVPPALNPAAGVTAANEHPAASPAQPLTHPVESSFAAPEQQQKMQPADAKQLQVA